MNTWLRAVLAGIVAITLAAVVYWARLPTYEVFVHPRTTSAFWNDDQLVVFVAATYRGRSTTVFDRTRIAACKRFRNDIFRPLCRVPLTPALSGQGISIVRYERGAASRILVADRGIFGPKSTNPPRIFDGRLYVLGGVWTGRALESVPPEQQGRVSDATGSNDLTPWHVALTLEGDVPVRLGGETLVLRAQRGPAFGEFVIDLVQPQQPPVRLWSGKRGGEPATIGEEDFRLLFEAR